MTTRNTVLTVVIVLIVLALGWYWYSWAQNGTVMPDTSNTDSTTSQGTDTTGQTTHSSSKSLRTLASQGGNYTCTLTTTGDQGKMTGTIFASAGKTRLDFKISLPTGTDITSHTIRSGSIAYNWVDGQQTGSKLAITASSAIVPQPTGGSTSVNDEVQVDSDCHPWSPDASQFVPPTGITFVAQ